MLHPHRVTIARTEKSLAARRRVYPKFKDGMTVEQYVHAYYGLNSLRWKPCDVGIQRGVYTPDSDYEALRQEVNAFFQPLSTAPQFAQNDTVVEEVLA